jgi:peptide/nickel transport system substrate-binding protein
MIDILLAAETREDFVTAVRAYDRVLLSGFYVVPLYHLGEQRIARWKSVAHPETVSIYGYQLPSWWHAE